MQVQAKHNNSITIASTPFAKGGEGALYDVVSPANLRHLCAKIYHVDKRDEVRERKITFLLEHNPNDSYERDVLVWVEDVLYQDGKFVGFLMPKQEGFSLEILCSHRIPKRFQSDWGHLSLGNELALKRRMEIACRLCMAVHQLHASQRYLLIDIKPENILIDAFLDVYIVDLDSVEVLENGKTLFDAPVSTPEYTPAEHYQKLDYDPTETVQWDLFGLGVIMYKLFFGIHPFTGTCIAPHDQYITISSKIEQGLVPLGDGRDLFDIIPAPHQRFDELPSDLKELFLDCFIKRDRDALRRPSAIKWIEALLVHISNEELTNRYAHLFDHAPFEAIRLPAFESVSLNFSTFRSNALERVGIVNEGLPKLKGLSVVSLLMDQLFNFLKKRKNKFYLLVGLTVAIILIVQIGFESTMSILFLFGLLALMDHGEKLKGLSDHLDKPRNQLRKLRSTFKKDQHYLRQSTFYKELTQAGISLKKVQSDLDDFNTYIRQINTKINQQVVQRWLKKLKKVGVEFKADSVMRLRLQLIKKLSVEMDQFIAQSQMNKKDIDGQISAKRKQIVMDYSERRKQLIDDRVSDIEEKLQSTSRVNTVNMARYFKGEIDVHQFNEIGVTTFLDIQDFSLSRNEIWLTVQEDIKKIKVSSTHSAAVLKGLYQWQDEYAHYKQIYEQVKIHKMYPNSLLEDLSQLERQRNNALSVVYDSIFDSMIKLEDRQAWNDFLKKKQKIREWIEQHNQDLTAYLNTYVENYKERYDQLLKAFNQIGKRFNQLQSDMYKKENDRSMSDSLDSLIETKREIINLDEKIMLSFKKD